MQTEVLLLIIPLVAFELVMRVIALIGLARAEKVRGPKALWAVIILCVSLFGWVAWFLAGREET